MDWLRIRTKGLALKNSQKFAADTVIETKKMLSDNGSRNGILLAFKAQLQLSVV